MIQWVFVNDDFVPKEKATLHFTDLAFQRGYGIFDFFRLRQNEPLFLDDHLDRFYFSAATMHLPVALDRDELKQAIAVLIQKNNLPGTGLRISLTGGYSTDGFSLAKPNLLLSQQPLSPPTQEQISKGIKLLSYPYQRQLSEVKTIDYLTAIWLQPKRIEHDADDILYHFNGSISECPRSNIFFITGDKKLVTPKENVLAGITRKKLIELAKEQYEIEERSVSLAEIKTAKEVFITSTIKQILPVRQIDDTVFASTTQSQDLLRAFQAKFSC